MSDEFKTLKKFDAGSGREGFLHSLPALEEQGIGPISRLPVSIRIVLESVLRNCDGKKVRRKDVETLAKWNATNAKAAKRMVSNPDMAIAKAWLLTAYVAATASATATSWVLRDRM